MSISWDRRDVQTGMYVTGTNGKRLGKVIRSSPETFVVEKGGFFPKDYELRYERITGIGGEEITYELSDFDLNLGGGGEATRASLAAAAAARTASKAATGSAATARTATTAEARGGLGERKELRVPLMDEEVGVEKVARETGHVRIHKTVRTEERHFTVPVAREDVVIERLAYTSSEPTLPSESAFHEQMLDVPLYEEDVRVTKQPRLREEMVVRTVVQAVEKEAEASLRHEDVEIEDTRRPLSERRADGSPVIPSGFRAPGSGR